MVIYANTKSPGKSFFTLTLTEVEELYLAEDLFNTDPAYNFQACVRESLSSQVGCRTFLFYCY